MIALALTDVKECMSKLLLSETFDPFLFIEGEIMTFGTFSMDGYLKKDFYEEGTAPEREYALWKDMREYCFSLIKGKRTPLGFKFVLGLSESNIEKCLVHRQIPGLVPRRQQRHRLFSILLLEEKPEYNRYVLPEGKGIC